MRSRAGAAAAVTLALLGACGNQVRQADQSSRAGADGGSLRDAARDMSGAADGGDGGRGLSVMPLSPPDAQVAQPSPAAGHDAASPPDAALARDEDAGVAPPVDAATTTPTPQAAPYAAAVTRFTPGANAGFGADAYPDVVLGPPRGGGTGAGSLDVLSLGVGGEIVLDFGELEIVDEAGADFLVFENPFWPGDDATGVFAEPGEVAVSADGSTWRAFACDPQDAGDGRFRGCAGWTPTRDYDPLAVVPLDPALTGGDAFDLAQLGLARARYVRIRDLSDSGEGSTAGFDLDAVGLIHFAARPATP